MTRDEERVVAWNLEMQTVHHRLEEALRTARSSVGSPVRADVLVHCHGFCAALTAHHTSEDAALFPRLLVDHPELLPVVRRLVTEHEVLAELVRQFEDALLHADLQADLQTDDGASARRQPLEQRLDELQAAMTAHFAHEERELDRALDDLRIGTTQAGALLG